MRSLQTAGSRTHLSALPSATRAFLRRQTPRWSRRRLPGRDVGVDRSSMASSSIVRVAADVRSCSSTTAQSSMPRAAATTSPASAPCPLTQSTRPLTGHSTLLPCRMTTSSLRHRGSSSRTRSSRASRSSSATISTKRHLESAPLWVSITTRSSSRSTRVGALPPLACVAYTWGHDELMQDVSPLQELMLP